MDPDQLRSIVQLKKEAGVIPAFFMGQGPPGALRITRRTLSCVHKLLIHKFHVVARNKSIVHYSFYLWMVFDIGYFSNKETRTGSCACGVENFQDFCIFRKTLYILLQNFQEFPSFDHSCSKLLQVGRVNLAVDQC